MKTAMLLTSLTISAAAFAKPLPLHLGRGPQVPVSRMTCAQAHSFATKYGYYYQETADGLLPMYPLEPTPSGLACSGTRSTPHPETVRTLDTRACILSWYCI